MKSINIKGKDYIEVNERVKEFVKNYPQLSLETELLSNENGVCIFKAIVKDLDGRTVSTGHAYEKEGSTFINKTSYIENCETSAVGRALGFMGIGIDTSIASAEEVQTAIENQKPKMATPEQIASLEEWKLCFENQDDFKAVAYIHESLKNDLTYDKAKAIIAHCEAKADNGGQN